MRPWDAVKAGYDEITHINFVAMQAMPQAVVDKANTAQRLEGPAKYFKDVDLNAEPRVFKVVREHRFGNLSRTYC